MTPDQLRAALAADGWRFGKAHKDTGVPWYAWQKLAGSADCAHNEKPPSLILNPYELHVHDQTWHSVEFEVCGEAACGRWLNLKSYSVRMDEAMTAYPRCAALLRAAWNAAAALPAPVECE